MKSSRQPTFLEVIAEQVRQDTPAGKDGEPGLPGKDGPVGPKGEKGEKGEKGDLGPRGEPGSHGPIGPVGPKGPSGERGPQGTRGDNGAVGSIGPKGDRGDKGYQGERGARGDQGPQGPQGVAGPQGAPGFPPNDEQIGQIVSKIRPFMPRAVIGGWGNNSASSFSGAYEDLTGKPTLGSAAATASTDYATAAQGAKADTALQNAAAFATAAQGATADSAAQKASNLSDLQSAATARTNLGLGTAATTDAAAYATAAQGTDARTPTAHASTHAIDGTDPVVPLEVYVKDEALVIGSGNVLIVAATGVVWTDATVWGTMPFTLFQPPTSIAFWPGAVTLFYEDPFILDAPLLADLGGNANTIAWTDSARCPQTISTLLVIGV